MTLSRRASVLISALLLAVGWAETSAADARSYKNGLNALDDARYADAERYFREAIVDRSEERSGGLRRTYLPHFYLGVALARQGRCADALEVWKESEAQGQVQRTEEGAELPGYKQRCLDRVGALDSARGAAEQAVARARKASQTLGRLREGSPLADLWSRGEPSLAAREAAARERLEEAARLLGSEAGEDPGPLQQAKTQANQAATEFDEIRSDAQASLAELRDAESNALERLQASEAKARAGLGQLAHLEPFPPELRRKAVAVTKALDETVERKAEAGADELVRLRQTLDAAAAGLAEAAQGPPGTLRAAAEAFLAGRHDDVLATLEGETYRDQRATGQACLLRAASRFELQQRARDRDPAKAAALREDVLGCRKLVAAAAIPTRYFSPRFIRFYQDPPEPEAGADEDGPDPAAEPESSSAPGGSR